MHHFKLVNVILAFVSATAGASAHAQNFDSVMSSSPLMAIANLARVDPAKFLGEVQGMVNVNNSRDLAALGMQAAKIALHIEELQISFLQNSICKSTVIPTQYSKEVQIGCELLGAQADLNRIKQKALTIVVP